VRNVIVTNNVHHTGNRANASFVVDESAGSFAAVTDVTVTNNEVGKADAIANKTSTRAELTAPLAAGDASALLDFGPYLLFPNVPIAKGSVRCWLYGPHATAISVMLRSELEHTVLVTLAQPVPSHVANDVQLVTCAVDQSARACPAE
jgi:hypothetical protein